MLNGVDAFLVSARSAWKDAVKSIRSVRPRPETSSFAPTADDHSILSREKHERIDTFRGVQYVNRSAMCCTLQTGLPD